MTSVSWPTDSLKGKAAFEDYRRPQKDSRSIDGLLPASLFEEIVP